MNYDIAILGGGIGGALLGAILSANGRRVVLIESGVHPRFAIGESTIPETTILLRLMAERFNVPELAHLCSYHSVRANVSCNCGVKRNFSFHYHRPDQDARAEERNQFLTWAPPYGPDIHYFRQDTDAYMLAVAAQYGATVLQQTRIGGIDFDDSGVDISTTDGLELRVQFVVDAGGMNALIPRVLKLREEACRFRTRSRTVFTHMVGVAPYDSCSPLDRGNRLPSPTSQGTLHHLFEGGWIWVIPFDNHPLSNNSLCSVGMTLDLAKFSSEEIGESDFRNTIARFPSIARQFEHAKAIRPWVGTGRLQYSATSTVGNRFCLLPHADSFVDPLFSSGLAVTMMAINSIAPRLIEAKSSYDYSAKNFGYVETWTKKLFDYYDRLVSASYTSFVDYSLWNAWHRVWMVGSLYGSAGLFEILGRSLRDSSVAAELFETPPYRGLQGIDFEPFSELFDRAYDQIVGVSEGRHSSSEAAERIFQLLESSGLCPPQWRLTDPSHRTAGSLTLLPSIRLIGWGRFSAPPSVREHYFQVGRAGGLFGTLIRLGCHDLMRGIRSFMGVLRDAVFSWNRDWKIRVTPPYGRSNNERT